MKSKIIALALILGFLACTKVPMTGRRQMKFIPSSELNSMSFQNYAQFVKENKTTTNPSYTNMVKNSGAKISAEVMKYNDFTTLGSESAVKEAGKFKVEGKEYVVEDGDVMHFRFNV